MLAAGCGPTRSATYQKSFAEGERAQTAGRYSDAATAYASASEQANGLHDKEFATYLSGMMQARDGNIALAVRTLKPIADGSGEYAASAAYKLADLEITHGDETRGYAMVADVPARFPDHGIGRVALTRTVRHLRDTTGDASRARVARLGEDRARENGSRRNGVVRARKGPRRPRTEQGSARLFFYGAETWPYPNGAFFDDALYSASFEDEKLGDADAAIADLQRLLSFRTSAWFYGSAQRPKYSPALYRIAVLYDERKKDRGKAREALWQLYTDHTTSPLRDDALFYDAKLWEAEGDHARACDTLKTLVTKLEDSKFVPCAEARCGLVREAKSKGAEDVPRGRERSEHPSASKAARRRRASRTRRKGHDSRLSSLQSNLDRAARGRIFTRSVSRLRGECSRRMTPPLTSRRRSTSKWWPRSRTSRAQLPT